MSKEEEALEFLEQREAKQQEDKAICDLCESEEEVYFCESGHKSRFCRSCLIKTERRGEFGRYSITKCKDKTCTFIPMNAELY
tara:strand:+ start:464 stop:712 length:249 start_codon:yes stop_codon:yes gene_type:complete